MPRWSTPLLALALAGAVVGCTADEQAPEVARPAPTVGYSADEVPVIVPGAPGETPTVVQPGESGTMANPDAYRDADVTFVTDMVGHHAQALEMAELAPERAADERVVALAERIAAAQGPEIESMQAWLTSHGLPAADLEGGHGRHGGMAGMASAEDMTRLVAARGEAFDRLFLQLMTRHHEGALQMADEAVDAGHPLVTEMIDDTVASQSVEIDRMQELLADL